LAVSELLVEKSIRLTPPTLREHEAFYHTPHQRPKSQGDIKRMHLQGSFETPAPRKAVWEFLLNPEDIAPCFPDLQSMEVLSRDTFKARVKVGLSIVKGIMDFEFRTVDKVPPSSAKLVGTGKGVGSKIEIQTGFTLEETQGGTKVGWVADVNVGGVMGGLGAKLLDSTSSKMVEQVIDNLKSKLKEKGSA
jgi:carbon monoxide dehydrogenase subunit G